MEEDQLSRGNFLQPCLRALVRNARDLCREQGAGERGPERQPAAVVDGDWEGEEEEEGEEEGRGAAAAADVAQDLGRCVDRFAALMERRFRGLELGRAAAAAAKLEEEEDDEEEDEDGPVVVPWEEVSRALGEIDEGGRGAALSTIQEEDPTAAAVAL